MLDESLERVCATCGSTFHRTSLEFFTNCALCGNRLPHALDEESYEEQATKLLEAMEAEILLEHLFSGMQHLTLN